MKADIALAQQALVASERLTTLLGDHKGPFADTEPLVAALALFTVTIRLMDALKVERGRICEMVTSFPRTPDA